MNSKLIVFLALTLSACGGSASYDTNYTPTPPVNPYANLSDGVHILSFSCTNSNVMELSNTPATRTLIGIVGARDFGQTSTVCKLKVASVKGNAGRPFDVIITSGSASSVKNGHIWPYSNFPLCVGSTDLSLSSSCVNTGMSPQTDISGVATIDIAIDNVHNWNGMITLKSSLKFNEDGNSYSGTKQEFAIISAFNGRWVNNDGNTCNWTGSGTCSNGPYPGYMVLVSPADFSCQVLPDNNEDFRSVKTLPVCQPL